jgi:hypothetical protein
MGIRTVYCSACGIVTGEEIKKLQNVKECNSESEKELNCFNNYVDTISDTRWLKKMVVINIDGQSYDCVSTDDGYGVIETTGGWYNVLYHGKQDEYGIMMHESCYKCITEYNDCINIYHLYDQLLRSKYCEDIYGEKIMITQCQFPRYYLMDPDFEAIPDPTYFADPCIDNENKERIINIFEHILCKFGDKIIYKYF